MTKIERDEHVLHRELRVDTLLSEVDKLREEIGKIESEYLLTKLLESRNIKVGDTVMFNGDKTQVGVLIGTINTNTGISGGYLDIRRLKKNKTVSRKKVNWFISEDKFDQLEKI